MTCPQTLLGSENYFIFLALAVGALINLIKRLPKVHADALPVLAFVIGWGLDTAAGGAFCGLAWKAAALAGLGGGFAGLAAAGGHEALMRTANRIGLSKPAEKLLGTAKEENAKRLNASIVFFVLFLGGCSSFLPALAKAAQGAQWLGTVIDVAETGSRAYFARHPSLENQSRFQSALARSKQALAAFDAALATGKAIEGKDLAKARSEALNAYAELYALIRDLGIMSATPPAGGAETDAPKPEPFNVPKPAQLGAAW